MMWWLVISSVCFVIGQDGNLHRVDNPSSSQQEYILEQNWKNACIPTVQISSMPVTAKEGETVYQTFPPGWSLNNGILTIDPGIHGGGGDGPDPWPKSKEGFFSPTFRISTGAVDMQDAIERNRLKDAEERERRSRGSNLKP